MNPLFFGSSDRPLFGVYHPPRTRDARTMGIVLCYPLGTEYMRAHRAFRQLAILLSKAGFPVLRFDYYGTGDSGGDSEAGSFEQWQSDIGTAIDELKDNATVSQVILVGLRLGASLAARVQSTREDVASVVLWDPVVDGGPYLRDLATGAGVQLPVNGNAGQVVGINGFPWTATLRAAVEAVNLESFPLTKRTHAALLVSEEREGYTKLRDRYAAASTRNVYRCIPSPGDWSYIDAYGSALLPQDIIQGIVAHVSNEGGA